jgi:hypothetical protein
MFGYELDIGMFECVGKLKLYSLLPKTVILEAFTELLLILLQLFADFLDADLQSLSHLLAAGGQRSNNVSLRQ